MDQELDQKDISLSEKVIKPNLSKINKKTAVTDKTVDKIDREDKEAEENKPDKTDKKEDNGDKKEVARKDRVRTDKSNNNVKFETCEKCKNKIPAEMTIPINYVEVVRYRWVHYCISCFKIAAKEKEAKNATVLLRDLLRLNLL